MKKNTPSITFFLILIFLVPLACAKKENKLDVSRSKIEFTTTKDDGVKVPGVFKNFEGYFKFSPTPAGEELHGEVTVDINSLSTNNPARDYNIRTIFFETEKGSNNQKAHFTFNGKLLKKDIPTDGSTVVNLQGDLEMHGKSVSLEIPVTVTQQTHNVEIKNAAPVILEFASWNLMEVVPALMKACNHKALEPKASLNIDLFFPN